MTRISRRRLLALGTAGLASAVAGCAGRQSTPTPGGEATVTVRLTNRDDEPREYEVIVQQGESARDSFSGSIPPGERVEMIATLRVTDAQYSFSVSTAGGQTGQTWEPTECRDLLVEAAVEDGDPEFETTCRGA